MALSKRTSTNLGENRTRGRTFNTRTSTDIHPTDVTQNDYVLNIEKSLEKKLIAAKRIRNWTYEYTGGGIVVEADAATYELFKTVAIYYYNTYPSVNGKAHTTTTTDNTNQSVVQLTVRVSDQNSQNNGYTINMYHTTSKIMVNGKNINKFIQEDLGSIHALIEDTLKSNKNTDIKAINNLMKEQLENLLSQFNVNKGSPVHKSNECGYKSKGKNENSLNTSTETQNIKCASTQDINCIKCKRPCKTKSSYCDKGHHWTHYKCEKLSDEEIEKIEKDKTTDHHCKICISQNATNITLVQITATDLSRELLDEENQLAINNRGDDLDACTICNSIYDKTSLQYEENLPTCYSCIGIKDQNKHTTPKIIEMDIAQVRNQPAIPTQTISPETQAKKNNQTTVIKTAGTSNNQNGNQATHSNQAIKMGDLRQKEIKIRKWEEELKIKERMLQDDQNRYVRLETYIKKLESEKEEYENTIRTLKRKIVLLEEPQTNVKECYERTSKTSNDTLTHSIQDRVTSYILRQVDQQIQKMEDNKHTAGQTKYETPTTGVKDKHQEELTRDRINVNKGSPVHRNHNAQETSTYPCNQTPMQMPSVQNRYQESDIYLRNQIPNQMPYVQNTNQISQIPQNDYTRMENNIVYQYTQNVNKGSPVHEPNLSTGIPQASTHMVNQKSENQAYIMVPQHTLPYHLNGQHLIQTPTQSKQKINHTPRNPPHNRHSYSSRYQFSQPSSFDHRKQREFTHIRDLDQHEMKQPFNKQSLPNKQRDHFLEESSNQLDLK